MVGVNESVFGAHAKVKVKKDGVGVLTLRGVQTWLTLVGSLLARRCLRGLMTRSVFLLILESGSETGEQPNDGTLFALCFR